MNKIYAQSHGTFHAYQKKHGSKFTLTILAAALLVTFHTTTIASTTLASSTTPPLPGQSPVTLTYSATGAKVVYDSSMKNPHAVRKPLFVSDRGDFKRCGSISCSK